MEFEFLYEWYLTNFMTAINSGICKTKEFFAYKNMSEPLYIGVNLDEKK